MVSQQLFQLELLMGSQMSKLNAGSSKNYRYGCRPVIQLNVGYGFKGDFGNDNIAVCKYAKFRKDSRSPVIRQITKGKAVAADIQELSDIFVKLRPQLNKNKVCHLKPLSVSSNGFFSSVGPASPIGTNQYMAVSRSSIHP